MAGKRKLWSTTMGPISTRVRHESEAATYRYVRAQGANWLAGALRFQRISVWVDERNGQGWQLFDRVDLAEIPEPIGGEQ